MRLRLLEALNAGVDLGLRDEFSPQFNHWEWRIQRAGWLVIALILVAALLGLFGGGIFSQATARHEAEGHTLLLHYPRFGRAESNLQLELEIFAPGQSASQVMAVLSGGFVDKAVVTSVWPEPDTQSLEGDRMVYTWAVEDWTEPLTVRFEYESRDWRSLGGRLDVETARGSLGSLAFKQFLFP